MSGTAKAFVVINLVLAVLFAGAAATYLARRNVDREALEKLQAEYNQDTGRLSAEVSQLGQEKADLQNQGDALADTNARQNTSLESTKAELDLERKNRLELDLRLGAMDDSLSQLKRSYEALAARNEALATELAEAKKTSEAAVIAKEDSIDKMREAQMQATAATTQFRNLAKELHSLRNDLARYKAAYPEPGLKYTPAEIYGKVKKVDGRTGIVIISVGEDDGVEQGMEFTVYRGEDGYIGKVIVTTVNKELSVARVDKSVSDQVKVGDNVSAAF